MEMCAVLSVSSGGSVFAMWLVLPRDLNFTQFNQHYLNNLRWPVATVLDRSIFRLWVL